MWRGGAWLILAAQGGVNLEVGQGITRLRGTTRAQPDPAATLASQPGPSLATYDPLPPHSVLFDRSIITGAQSKAASQATDHLPAVNRDQIRSFITSKMGPVSKLDESCSPKSCSRHGHLGRD